MPTYEHDSSYGRWSQPPRRPSAWPKSVPHIPEIVLGSAEAPIERKIFIFQIRENSRGRFLRITEEGNGKRSAIIIPANGLVAFKKLLDDMIQAGREIPPRGANPPPA